MPSRCTRLKIRYLLVASSLYRIQSDLHLRPKIFAGIKMTIASDIHGTSASRLMLPCLQLVRDRWTTCQLSQNNILRLAESRASKFSFEKKPTSSDNAGLMLFLLNSSSCPSHTSTRLYAPDRLRRNGRLRHAIQVRVQYVAVLSTGITRQQADTVPWQ